MRTLVIALVITLALAGWTLAGIAKFLSIRWSYRARRLLPTLKADALLRANRWSKLEMLGVAVFILCAFLLAWAQNFL